MRSLTELCTALARAGLLVSAPASEVAIDAIATDSRLVGPGALYVAVRGSQVDGHRFIPDALTRGAVAVAVEHPSGTALPEVIVSDGRRAAIALARHWYGDPVA
ncbi:MAG: Mur ligase domain-containing protein, partial [Gemmatimonadales bacterium]